MHDILRNALSVVPRTHFIIHTQFVYSTIQKGLNKKVIDAFSVCGGHKTILELSYGTL